MMIQSNKKKSSYKLKDWININRYELQSFNNMTMQLKTKKKKLFKINKKTKNNLLQCLHLRKKIKFKRCQHIGNIKADI